MKWSNGMLPRLPNPAEPSGWQPLSWGLPAGWDIPVYSTDLAGWVIHDAKRIYGKRWPAAPANLATAGELAEEGLRPLNALRPDALLVGPAHLNGQPTRVDWKSVDHDRDDVELQLAEQLGIDDIASSFIDDRYPTRALYQRDHTRPRHARPTGGERGIDRAEAATLGRDCTSRLHRCNHGYRHRGRYRCSNR